MNNKLLKQHVFSLHANAADVKSPVVHPATTIHSRLHDREHAEQSIKPNTIRLSVGTENICDIISDLQRGFNAVKE